MPHRRGLHGLAVGRGNPAVIADSRGFAFVQCGNPAGLGLKSRESREDGIDRMLESRGVDWIT